MPRERDEPATAKIQILILVIGILLTALSGTIAYTFNDFKTVATEDRNALKFSQEKLQVAVQDLKVEISLLRQPLQVVVDLSKANGIKIDDHKVNHPDNALRLDITRNAERIDAINKTLRKRE
jgi:uncharacterized protein YpmB